MDRDPLSVSGVEDAGIRSLISVPMLKDGAVVGTLNVYRREVRPFTDKQIALLQNFAGQAVIAIENARLLGELRQSLEQQTATADVLRVISASPGELDPVFNAMLENATRICDAEYGILFSYDGRLFNKIATRNVPPSLLDFIEQRGAFLPPAETALHDMLTTRNVAHRADASASSVQSAPVRLGGAKAFLAVPMFNDEALVGAISIYRQEARPFTEKQIALLQNFAAQAVIAIENARLLNELRQRTTDLSESLEQQTATSDVLRIISSSPGDLSPVFAAMLENATRLCAAKIGTMYFREGDAFTAVAMHGATSAYREARLNVLFHPGSKSALGRVVQTKQLVHIEDCVTEQAYAERDPLRVSAVELGGVRTLLSVPMLKENEVIGAIAVYRQEIRPFTDKQIALVQNFAAQAVIAIENARLLNELRESLERQTATADILRVIASTPEDSKHALDTIAETASRMFGVANVNFRRIEGDVLRIVSSAGPTIERLRKALPDIPLEATDPAVHCFVDNRQIPIEDRQTVLINERGAIAAALRELPVRSQVFTPLSRQGKAIGVMIVTRGGVQPFQKRDLNLMKGFADQAVIAIENARLLNELRQRTADLSETLEQQTATSEVLKVISSSPGELEQVFDAMLRNAVRICEAKFGILYRFDGTNFHPTAHFGTPPELIEFHRQRGAFQPLPITRLYQVMVTKQISQIADAGADRPYDGAATRLGGARSIVGVPMLKDNELIGALIIYRQEVRPFTDKQIELLKNFAAQAVIAIENARLLNDLNKLNQQLEQRVTDQVGEIERMGRLRRFLPPQVADLIVASGTEKQLESHRREITALFCDLRGFTGFSESSDPEDVMALLRDYHAAIGEIIVKYSGTLERFAGDGVMVIFNDPVPVENPALQAVLMALDMRAAIGAMIDKWRLLGHDLGFGIGIAHGFATLGTIGFEGRYDYAAIGTVSNVASRLCDEAKPGQILISPRVMLAVDKTVTVEPAGEFELKGIRRPMAAYNVVASSSSKPN